MHSDLARNTSFPVVLYVGCYNMPGSMFWLIDAPSTNTFNAPLGFVFRNNNKICSITVCICTCTHAHAHTQAHERIYQQKHTRAHSLASMHKRMHMHTIHRHTRRYTCAYMSTHESVHELIKVCMQLDGPIRLLKTNRVSRIHLLTCAVC